MSVTIILPQSKANTGDREILERLLANHSGLTRLDCVHRFSGGYSSARVYLAHADIGTQRASLPWIVKLGTTSEIDAEDRGLAMAKSFVPTGNIASRICKYDDGHDAVLVVDYAAYRGRTPIELEAALKRSEAVDAISNVVKVLERWRGTPEWRSRNLTRTMKDWLASKLPHLSETIRNTAFAPVVYSPDFGEAYANPAYHFARDIPKVEALSPIGFAHGDLNLRNVLFSRHEDQRVDVTNPVFIDLRHAAHDAYSLTDLAKLEACIRYQQLPIPDSYSSLSQAIMFLHATRRDIALAPLPDLCTDKTLQDWWRCIQKIRESAETLLRQHNSASPLSYWANLISYGITSATYSIHPTLQAFAYLDAAAMFTQHFVPRPPGEQVVLAAHGAFSPPVTVGKQSSVSPSHLSLFFQSIAEGQALLVIGPGYARVGGTEPMLAFLQRLHRALLNSDAPAGVPAQVLLDILQRQSSRQDILRVIRQKSAGWNDATDQIFAKAPWAGVVNLHLSSLPFAALTTAHGAEPLRIDSLEDATKNVDKIAARTTFYFPLLGDSAGTPDQLALTLREQRSKDEAIGVLMRGLEQRQMPLTLVFWRCDDVAIEQIAALQSIVRAERTVSIDCYYVSELSDNARDSALNALGAKRVGIKMGEIIQTVAQGPTTAPPEQHRASVTWTSEGRSTELPDLPHYTRGLLRLFDESIAPTEEPRQPESFLLGGAATCDDINAGRVIRRTCLDASILPAIRGALAERDRDARVVVVSGRAGAGTSTLLCHACFVLRRDNVGPIVIADARIARGAREWQQAGELIAETSKITKSTLILVVDAATPILDDVLSAVGACVDRGGRVVAVIGGRREVLARRDGTLLSKTFRLVDVSDTLSHNEWTALAGIIMRLRLAPPDVTQTQLAERMKTVGRLLPALFEATDRKHRRFRDIVAYEYGLYGSNRTVQHAYRLICALGAYDVPISQYWLLKALGGLAMSEASRVLGALSDDIVLERDSEAGSGDLIIAPTHRVIAEEVVSIATPAPQERLQDVERLVDTANFGSQAQGLAIAALLYKGGPLLSWIERSVSSEVEREERIERLFKRALANTPHHPQVEVNLRQHYALMLRRWNRLDDALGQLKVATSHDPDNSATWHILGLVHESRALALWSSFTKSANARDLAKARSAEQDAAEFFRMVRDAKPHDEHGYEAEARLFRRKHGIFREAAVDSGLLNEARMQIYTGLHLLRVASERVPKARLKQSAKTRGLLLREAGDLEGAVLELSKARDASSDPVLRTRLTRSLAILAAELERWPLLEESARKLLEAGERDASAYLMLDQAAEKSGATLQKRMNDFRESAESFNRWDVETQVRWAELSLAASYFDRAEDALRRADEIAKESMGIQERERVRALVLDGAIPRRFGGRVVRLLRPDEGYVAIDVSKREIFFRSPIGDRGLRIGSRLTFSIALRIRGLRAIDVTIDD